MAHLFLCTKVILAPSFSGDIPKQPTNSTMSDEEANNDIPRFVEPDYNLDLTAPAVKEADPDSYCTRLRSEWRYPWFSIQEGDKVLDIPASFGLTSWTVRLFKFAMMILFNATTAYKWYLKRDHPAFFLAFLTNWGLLFSCLFTIMSFINSMAPPAQPKRPSDSVSTWIKVTWLLFAVASEFTLIVTLLYWSLDYEPGAPNNDLGFVNIFTHAGVLLVWPLGLLVDCIPVRLKHMMVSAFLAACYVLWLVIHQLATDIGNPNNPETDDDLLYEAVDFKEKTAFSTILVLLVIFVITPLMHLLLWSLSLLSCPCNCSGYNRRYISETKDKSTTAGTAAESTANVNIYEDP